MKYAATGVGAIALIVLGLWPFLEPSAWNGVLVAAAIALTVQVAAFAVLNRSRGALNGFMMAWVGGMMVRTMVIAAVAVIVIRSGTESAVPLLLALAGFFFGLLLLEPVFFRVVPNQTAEA